MYITCVTQVVFYATEQLEMYLFGDLCDYLAVSFI